MKKNKQGLLRYYGFAAGETEKFPVITGILKKMTPEMKTRYLEAVGETGFSPGIQKWINEYKKIGKRNDFTWKLFLYARKEIECFPAEKIYSEELEEAKFLIAMLTVLIDDAADCRQDLALLSEIHNILFYPGGVKRGI